MNEWIYLKLYAGDYADRLDHLVCETVPRAVAAAPHRRWFFLRYYDEHGAHVRLRFDTDRPAETIAALSPLCLEGVQQLATVPVSDYRPLIATAPDGEPVERRVGVMRDVYEPELDKFGGVAGMPIAEAVFHASSELALEVLCAERDGAYSRKSVVADLMAAAVAAFPPAQDAAQFWRGFAAYWLGGDTEWAKDWRRRFVAKRRDLEARAYRVTGATPAAASSVVERWRDALAAASAAYRRAVPDASTSLLAAQFVHLMNNRLGLTTIEEAYLATLLEPEQDRTAA